MQSAFRSQSTLRTCARTLCVFILLAGAAITSHAQSRLTLYVAGDHAWAPHLEPFLENERASLAIIHLPAASDLTTLEQSSAWANTLGHLHPHDVVLLPIAAEPALDDPSLRRLIRAVQQRKADPVLLTAIPDLQGITRTQNSARLQARQIAFEEHSADIIDLTGILAREFTHLGPAATGRLFTSSGTLTPAGEQLVAARIVSGFRSLLSAPLLQVLSPSAAHITPADELAFPWPQNPHLPTIWLLGDSTMRNGDGTGIAGLWGWGDLFSRLIDPTRLNVANVAVSGRSSRTFYTFDWPYIRPRLRPGDVVLIQFGHNDAGDPADPLRARASLPGLGNETTTILNPITGRTESVHTLGWYLRQLIAEARQAGATPILCTPVPRNRWYQGRIVRADGVQTSQQLAATDHIPLIDLNSLIAAHYEVLGRAQTTPLFADGFTHSTLEGATRIAATALGALEPLAPLAIQSRLPPAPSTPTTPPHAAQ